MCNDIILTVALSRYINVVAILWMVILLVVYSMKLEENKKKIYEFWNKSSCGESLYLSGSKKEDYINQSIIRYNLEPMISNFANFELYKDKKVLEIGVGLGADHQKFAESGAILHGIDLTERSINHTKKRFFNFLLYSELLIADAEQLPYSDDMFDLVYSWGCLHHTTHTDRAIQEVFRVLKSGGEAKIMIYHKNSIVGYLLWIYYALLKGKPLKTLNEIYYEHLESPGTKAYTVNEARLLFNMFTKVKITTTLTHGDLLSSNCGQKHKNSLLSLAKLIWPRWLIKLFFRSNGLFMMIHAIK